MDLLAFARGPALQFALFVLVLGILWRLTGVLLLPAKSDLSEPRRAATWKGLRMIVSRMWPRRDLIGGALPTYVLGYTFHIGFAVVVLFYLPHLLFFEDIFKAVLGRNLNGLVGVSWPYLSGGTIMMVGAITLAALIALLAHRITSPVKRLISNFDDYLSWLLTTAPLVTGMLAYAHVFSPYPRLLGLHILSVELLMVWFPFGKLMHAFTFFLTRGVAGMAFERKGAAL